ncbi:cell division protein [Halobacteriovorax marinus SJ]|uniref:Cell division protein n=1 Tax=Halobacteriovorax marinus (strain ATCC BAA-682 / DSM 15412 / SJ) TaxID=862908 RepID=E1X013_HALMS|nr:signal recognition particle-docking protein FtsY [Halobacteriovorax marinus]CBW27949.1 cell division protein [Halobacteriovorax marinus SJ]
MNDLIKLLQNLYDQTGQNLTADINHVYGAGGGLSLLLVLVLFLLFRKSPTKKLETPEQIKDQPTFKDEVEQVSAEIEAKQSADEVEKDALAKEESPKEEPTPVAEEKVEEKVVEISWRDRLRKGLSRSSSEVWGKIGAIFTGKGLDDDTLEEVEELLYGADIGPTIAVELIEGLEEEAKKDGFGEKEFKKYLKTFLDSKMNGVQATVDSDLYKFNEANRGKTKVIMVVGVNGAGKTTTIGKLATKLTAQGAKVVVGACDTFRAAAVDQLEVWCQRAGAQMIRAKEGANPSGVGYDALQTAINEGADYCILDTAGRLHTKGNLMEELKKSRDVLKKLDDSAPHQTLLVIDAITGQNALRQAEEFNNTLGLSGLIFTKCDGSSKAGSAIGIVDKLKVPIAYIGVGEQVEDLNIFNLSEYLDALLDLE